jgi:hypothetical protein
MQKAHAKLMKNGNKPENQSGKKRPLKKIKKG